jgi:DNA-binding MarR family transcriptional regulator
MISGLELPGADGVDNLKTEIVQQAGFQSLEEEALLNLIRTADCLNRALQHRIRPWGITATQYNVLRILRGAHPRGLTCSAVGERMLTAEPDITRLLSRLKVLKFVRQHRDRHDRRMIWTQISDAGLRLLSEMDPMIEKAPPELLGHLGESNLTELIRLLEAARSRCDGNQAPPKCEIGTGEPSGTGPTGQLTCDGKRIEISCDGRSSQPTCDGNRKQPTCDGKEATTTAPAPSDRSPLLPGHPE